MPLSERVKRLHHSVWQLYENVANVTRLSDDYIETINCPNRFARNGLQKGRCFISVKLELPITTWQCDCFFDVHLMHKVDAAIIVPNELKASALEARIHEVLKKADRPHDA